MTNDGLETSAQTFSINQTVGTICPGFDAEVPSKGKHSTITAPGPSGMWVLMDENPKHLNDAAFAFGMEQFNWYDVPGTYHDFGCGFAFADGHSETHRWSMRT